MIAEEEVAGVVLESPAYPRFARILAVVLVIDLVAFGLWTLPALRSVKWSMSGLLLFGAAVASIVWIGFWIVRSRTRLEGDVLTQTWTFRRRVHVAEITQIKLVHWGALDGIVAPRLLVRRGAAATWIHSADARLLTAFANRVAQRVALKKLPD